jgi:hypothetical protein
MRCLRFQSQWDREEFFIAQKTGILNSIAVETLNLAYLTWNDAGKKAIALRDTGICHVQHCGIGI